jgi:putative phosphoesterase
MIKNRNMRIGIISDTHDDEENTRKAIEIFQKEKVDFVIHLGDYVSPPIVRLFKGLKLIGIFGNNDGYKYMLMKAFDEIGGEIKGDFATLEIDNLKIALYHGEFKEITEALAKCQDFDVVFAGHWHKFEKKNFGKSLLINLGSAHRFFSKDPNPTIGIFNTKTKDFKLIEIK